MLSMWKVYAKYPRKTSLNFTLPNQCLHADFGQGWLCQGWLWAGVILVRGDCGQGWLWQGWFWVGVILGRGDQDSGVILEGWFWRGDFGGVILSGVIVVLFLFHQLASIFGVNIKLMLKGQIVCTKHLLPPDLFYNLHFFTHNYVPIYKKHIYLGFGNFCTWWVFSNFFCESLHIVTS